ncbi:MOSC domain-containing protein [Jannaschia aquimarina]|uniref:YuaD protein n=1 Tax=Jannaschia aquimarina TaxID=935700 RepID=A0A0D1EI68_9RHOB|nr:sulfurase [Jannaschia aquimarina]KIT15540.1 putative metal-sulfur cluster biosynthesis proteins YuaD [Jannaschia aquimarina]SNT34759.1 hypothetical protein SAMN05421775_11269 [Jannaschia aquimarina]
MPALLQTDLTGEVVWLGTVPDRQAQLASAPTHALTLTFAGPEGEDHGGLTRPSCSRVTSQYLKGTEIANTRQLSILCAAETRRIASGMGIEDFDPAWLGATMVIEGLPDFSHLPPSSRLQFGGKGGATVVVDMQNRPCTLPAPVIEAAAPGTGAAFKGSAKGLRGVTAWVEREGNVELGQKVTLHIPDQRAWKEHPRGKP